MNKKIYLINVVRKGRGENSSHFLVFMIRKQISLFIYETKYGYFNLVLNFKPDKKPKTYLPEQKKPIVQIVAKLPIKSVNSIISCMFSSLLLLLFLLFLSIYSFDILIRTQWHTLSTIEISEKT